MKPFIVCTFVALLSGALAAQQDLTSKWEEFKAKHGKQHPSHEEAERKQMFAERHAEIEAHNARYAAGLESFSRQLNQYSDLSDEELDKHAFGFISDVDDAPVLQTDSNVTSSLPASFDWRDRGVITPAKDQKLCGACYAFVATALLEAHMKIKTGIEYDFSEQDIIDCSFKRYHNTFNQGCKSGTLTVTFDYVNTNGIALESSYPYTSGRDRKEGICRLNREDALGGRQVKLVRVKVRDEVTLAQLLVSKGPLIVSLGIPKEHKRMFSDHRRGIFDIPDNSKMKPTHVVLLVGFGTENEKPFWVVKNAWGPGWGVNGFGKLARGKNLASILQGYASYVES